MARAKQISTAGVQPLDPRRKWRAITIATLLLVPAYWAMLAGAVATTSSGATAPNAGAALALGVAVVPFVFILLAFMSGHPRAPGAVLKAMGLAAMVGVMASALAADVVTGIVAGVGAGGVVALRADSDHSWRTRAVAVAFAAVYVFALARTASAWALLPAPVFPLTAIGIADHYNEWRRRTAHA